MADSDDYFGWLFRMTVSDACFRWLFRTTVSDDCFGCLFQMTFRDGCSGWLFRMTISDDYSRCLIQMTVPDDYFVRLFPMLISDDFSRSLFRMTVRDSTTDSYFSDQFVFPRPIPISTNHSADWSHDWFVFERRLPTAELWPRSPLIFYEVTLNKSCRMRYFSVIVSKSCWCSMGPSIKYVCKTFRKTNISNFLIRTRTCAYQYVCVSGC